MRCAEALGCLAFTVAQALWELGNHRMQQTMQTLLVKWLTGIPEGIDNHCRIKFAYVGRDGDVQVSLRLNKGIRQLLKAIVIRRSIYCS